MRRYVAALLLSLLYPLAAHAHKPSDSYLALQVEGAHLRGQWDIALRDLEYGLGIDQDGDGAITWGELRSKHGEIAAYALARLKIAANGDDCALKPTAHLVDEHSDGAYAVLRFSANCRPGAIAELTADYRLFFNLDPTHRGLPRIQHAGGPPSRVPSPERPPQSFLLPGSSRCAHPLHYLR